MSAQVPTGTILGQVTDSQGLAVAGATVTLRNQDTSQTQVELTTSRGAYEFTYLNAGLYSVEISRDRFRNSAVKNIKLDASTEYSVPPVVMEIGPVSETVIVEGGANLVRTAGAEITGTVEKGQIEELPLLDRNPLALLSTQTGVVVEHRGSGLYTTVINGMRQSFGNLTLDGINIQDNFIRTESLDYTPAYLFMSQVAEFTASTQNAGPQAGIGSSQVSLITPSGTNTWHGEGFWNYKSGAWSANDWFNDANGIPKPNLLQNQAGGDIGGPVAKGKLFVYGAYELLRFRYQLPTNTTVLTNTARQGIFRWRAACVPAMCPSGVTPGSIQSMNLLTATSTPADPVMAALLSRVPTTINNPSLGDGLNTGGFSLNQRDNTTRDNTSIRLDWNASPLNAISGTYAWSRYVSDRPGSTLGLPSTYDAVPQVYNDDDDHFLSTAWRWSPHSKFTNEARFGFNLAPISFLTNQDFGPFTISHALFNNPNQNEFPSSRNPHTWAWQDNATGTRGSHVLNFGVQVQRVTVSVRNNRNTVPDLNLNYMRSGNPGLSGSQFSGGISDFELVTANQLLATLGGLVGSESQTFNTTSTTSGYVPGAPLVQDFRYDNWSLYAADSWRIRKGLEITYGLRWEYNSPFNEKNGLLQFPVAGSGQTIQSALLSDATLANFGGSTGRSVYKKDFKDFGPNIGFAWDPIGDGKTSVRAGYSINFVNDELIGAPYNASLSNPGVSTQTGPQFLKGYTVSNPKAISIPTAYDSFSGNWLNLYGTTTGNSFGYAVDPALRTPYVQQWNLSVQREIGSNTSITVSYVGNKGTKLYRAIDLNQVQILNNGFLQAFNVARQNGFLALAKTGTFDPAYNPGIPGSQPLNYFNYKNFYYGDLSAFYPTLVNQYLEEGAAGELANLYHSIGSDSSYLFSSFYGPGTVAGVSLAPNQYLEAADLLGNYSDSNYHAGSVEVRRRSEKGINVQASYTFSKVFTDYSADTLSGVQRFYPYLDNAHPRLEKARANFDFTHVFKANFLYPLPFGAGHAWSPSNAFLRRLASGWTTSSIFIWQSGSPFSILSGEGTLNRAFRSLLTNTAYATSSPQEISSQLGAYHSSGEVLLINPKYVGPDGRAAPVDALTCVPLVSGGFCNPAPGTVGNLPRNAFSGPAFFNWDFRLSKSVPISEFRSVKLRVDLFNAPNHPTFGVGDPTYGVANPGASPSDMYINDPTFGVATYTASTARVLQVGVVVSF